MVEWLDSLDSIDGHRSRSLQGSGGWRGRRGMDQRLGQRGFRRGIRQLLFRQVAVRRPGTLHQEVAPLQNGSREDSDADFPWHKRSSGADLAELDLLPHALLAWQGAGQTGYVPRRGAWPP